MRFTKRDLLHMREAFQRRRREPPNVFYCPPGSILEGEDFVVPASGRTVFGMLVVESAYPGAYVDRVDETRLWELERMPACSTTML